MGSPAATRPLADSPARSPAGVQLVALAVIFWWSVSLLAGGSSWIFLDYVNLAFHEAGHLVFRIGGSTLMYLGGTLGQLLVPLLLGARFMVMERRPFGAAVCLWWTGESLVNVSVYMADARELALPLVGGGDHDWNELFYRFGLLSESSVSTTSALTHLAGVAAMLLGIAWCGLFLFPGETGRRARAAIELRLPWSSMALRDGD